MKGFVRRLGAWMEGRAERQYEGLDADMIRPFASLAMTQVGLPTVAWTVGGCGLIVRHSGAASTALGLAMLISGAFSLRFTVGPHLKRWRSTSRQKR